MARQAASMKKTVPAIHKLTKMKSLRSPSELVLPNFAEELKYGVDLSTIWGRYKVRGMEVPHQPLNPDTQNSDLVGTIASREANARSILVSFPVSTLTQ